MSLDSLKLKIKNNEISGLFFFYGEDEYTKDFYSSQIRNIASKTLPEFNYTIIDAKNSTPNDLNSVIDTFPYMSETKLIELRNFNISKLSDSESNTYVEILSNIPNYCSLLITYRADEFDTKLLTSSSKSKSKSKNKVIDVIQKNGVIVEFKLPDNNKLSLWVIKHFKTEHIEINIETANYLIEYCGSDMYNLLSEIDKLCNYTKNTVISIADIEKVCCPNETYQTFDLTRAMLEKNNIKSLKIFDNLRYYKTDTTFILGTISKFLCDLSIIKAGLDSNLPARVVSMKSGISEWIVKKYISFIQQQNSQFLRFAVDSCIEADIKLKTSQQEPYSILEMLIIRISSYE